MTRTRIHHPQSISLTAAVIKSRIRLLTFNIIDSSSGERVFGYGINIPDSITRTNAFISEQSLASLICDKYPALTFTQ